MNYQELKEIAFNNPNGRIERYYGWDRESARPIDAFNCGSWKGNYPTRDFYEDVLAAAIRLNSNPSQLVGHPDTIKLLRITDLQYERPPYLLLLPIFWWGATKFLRFSDIFVEDETAEEGIILLIGFDENDVVYIDTR